MKAAAANGLEVSLPFFDRDVVDFLIRNRDWKADFSFLVNEGVGQDLAAMTDLLGSSPLGERFGFVRESAILRTRQRIEQELAGINCLTAWWLLDPVGLEFWLREFFPST